MGTVMGATLSRVDVVGNNRRPTGASTTSIDGSCNESFGLDYFLVRAQEHITTEEDVQHLLPVACASCMGWCLRE